MEIQCRDAFDFLESLPDHCAQLAIVDPPYNISGTLSGVGREGWGRGVVAEWDKFTATDYEAYITRLIALLQRKSQQQIVFFSYQYTKLFESVAEPYERLIWHREGGPRKGTTMKVGYEPFYWYCSHRQDDVPLGAPYIYSNTTTAPKIKDRDWLVIRNPVFEHNPYATKDKRLKADRVCSNVWNIGNLVGRKKERLAHPSQKPLALYRRIVEMASRPGDLIIDPFAGTGTASVACAELGRRCLACDNNPEFVAMANQRLRPQ